MTTSKLDKAYRMLVLSKFFTKGWGKPENLKKLFEFRKLVSDRKLCYQLVSPNYHVVITKEIDSKQTLMLEGYFMSPFHQYLPDLLPKEARKAHFQVILPKKWQTNHYKPVCLHLAGTGDHFFFRRRTLMAKPLLKEAGIGAILLENPFYGMRKPKDQVWSCLHNVSDIFVMGGCLILESLVLFHWCKRNGLGPLGITGISMGGHMASLAATAWPEPLALVPCLSWSTASIVFTRGVMSGAINWDLLETQYYDNEMFRKEIERMVRVVDDFLGSANKRDEAYEAGQHFAQNYPGTLEHMKSKITPSSKEESNPDLACNQLVNESKLSAYESRSNEADIFGNVTTTSVDNIVIKSAKDAKTSTASTTNQSPVVDLNCSSDNRDILSEVLEESNLAQYKKFLTLKQREELELGPISIRDYLAFRSKPELPDKKVDTCEKEKQREEASRFMCGIMDECTHLSNFSVPVDPELIISVAAKDDAYVPRDGITDVRDIWKGAEVRYLNSGHVGAFLLHQKVFRTAIIDAFDRMKTKYHSKETNSQPCE